MGQIEASEAACRLFPEDGDKSPSRRRSTSSDCCKCFDTQPPEDFRDAMERATMDSRRCDFEPLRMEDNSPPMKFRQPRDGSMPPWLTAAELTTEEQTKTDPINGAGYSQRDVMEFEKPSSARSARMPSMWRRRLLAGVNVSLDNEPVFVKHDDDLACLEIPAHDALVPLAVLKRCEALPCDEVTCDASHFELRVMFDSEEMETLVFQFDQESDRTGFANALEELAAEAKMLSHMGTLQPMDTDAVSGSGGGEESEEENEQTLMQRLMSKSHDSDAEADDTVDVR